MDIYTKGMGFDSDGEVVYSDDDLIMLQGKLFLLNRIMFHLLTEPGSYAPTPKIGLGLTRFIGRANNTNTLKELQKEINYYFRTVGDMYPYTVSSSVSRISNSEAELRLTVSGPNLSQSVELLLDITNGRLISSLSFNGEEETEVISITRTEEAGEVNPYIARLNQRRS